MEAKRVKELMIPLDDYAVVLRDASSVTAVRALGHGVSLSVLSFLVLWGWSSWGCWRLVGF